MSFSLSMVLVKAINLRCFVGIEKFGIKAITPAELLRAIGALP
jgi:hypothetical protein